jgi:hypothetical protein
MAKSRWRGAILVHLWHRCPAITSPMKRFFSLALLSASCLLGGGTVSSFADAASPLAAFPVEKLNEIAAQIRKTYAPDSRTARFEVKWQEAAPTIEVESTDATALAKFQDRLRQENITEEVHLELLPSRALGDKVHGIANLSVCNHRTSPANAAEMATQMLLGTPVDVLKRERGYLLVRTPDGYLSWTDDDGVALLDAASFGNWQRSEKVVFGHSFTQPSSQSLRVSDLVGGNILQLVARRGRFLQVRYPDGRMAYVLVAQTMPYGRWATRKNPGAQQIIATAQTLLGVPYLWGGTSAKGVDCSGLTKTAFFLNGIILPRDASQQALVGEEVDIRDNGVVSQTKCLQNLRPGDLLFFGSSRQPNIAPRVSHTAIYIGHGQFIQAAGQVRINSLIVTAADYDEVRARTLVGARRVLNCIDTPQITRVERHPLYLGSGFSNSPLPHK